MLCGRWLYAVELKTSNVKVELNDKGYYTSIEVNGQQILSAGNYPIVSAVAHDKIILPHRLTVVGDKFMLVMDDNQEITLLIKQQKAAITYEISEVPADYNVVVFGPLKVKLHEVVGEVVGVVQAGTIAFGMQALNIKTIGGIFRPYAAAYGSKFSYAGENTDLSVASAPYYDFAVADTKDGAVFQLSAKNRTKRSYEKVNQVAHAMVLPLQGSDGQIKGAKIALFGDQRSQILNRIGKVEIEQGLPHPIIEGEWGKISRDAMRSYMITDFSKDNLDFVLDKTALAGFKTLYHPGAFKTWGHFEWNPSLSTTGDAGIKALVEKAAKKGIQLGVHTLSNFMTTNDSYITPIPSKHLLKQGILKLTSGLDSEQTSFEIATTGLFDVPLTLNALQIGDELITFGKAEKRGAVIELSGCTRGAFGTTRAVHQSTEPLYKLWDYPYRTLFSDLELQDSFSNRLADIFNHTGLKQISFDGLEGCTYTGQDDYATSRFVSGFYSALKDKQNLINDASRLSHYLWHIHTRMNWGEPWGEEMRKGQVENRIKNQAYFKRNLFPRMLGWFLIRLADRKFEATSLEDLEWALSESAGFDAGYAMSISVVTLKKHGQIDTLLEAMKNWDYLRYHNVFTEAQKQKIKDPDSEWHLEKVDAKNFLLYPMFISERYQLSLSEMQPGQPGGADWTWRSPNESHFGLRIKVEGEGGIANPSIRTPLGTLKIIGKATAGQYILLNRQGKAILTDKNYNTISTLDVQGKALLPKGNCAVSFGCEVEGDTKPDLVIRYETWQSPEKITCP
ncbi:hypothetical protein GCM10027566_00300 [Arachidicoccus ginsenosidivorans]